MTTVIQPSLSDGPVSESNHQPLEEATGSAGDETSSKVTIGTLLSESAIYGIAKVFDPIIGFALLPIVTLLLQPQDYGLISLFTATSHVVFTLCSLGIHQAFLRFFTEATSQKEQDAVANSAVALAVSYWIVVLPIGLYFATSISESLFQIDSPALVYVLLAVSLVQTLDALGVNLLQAAGRAWHYLLTTIFSTVTVRVLALLLIMQGSGAWGWIIGESIGRTISMVLVVWLAMPRLRLRTQKHQAKELAWYGVMLVPAMLSFYVMTITDKFLIRMLAESPFEQIGFYTVGERIAGIMHMANIAIILGWQRFAFRNMHEDGGDGLIGYGLFVYLLGAGYMLLGLTMLGDDLTHWLIADHFSDGLAVIIPLTLAAFSGGLANMCDVGLHKRRLPHLISVVTTSAAVMNILLNLLVIPRYGIAGAAWATFFCQTLRLLVVYIASQWAFYIKFDTKRALQICALYLLVFAIGKAFDPTGWLIAGSVQLALVILTPFMVWVSPILSEGERDHVRSCVAKIGSVLSPSRFFGY